MLKSKTFISVKQNIYFLVAMFLLSVHGRAQSTTGLTGIPDTSFSVYGELNKNQKNHPGISIVNEFHSASVKEKRNIRYCRAGNRKLFLDVFYPAERSKQKRVAVMMIFGGGWRSGNRTQHHPLAQKLASLGYVCFTPDYRLSTEALYPAAIYDCKAAVRWIRKHAKKYGVDPRKITVAGFSAGGELAAFLASTNYVRKYEGDGCNSSTGSEVQALINIDGTLSFVHPESGEGDDSKKISAATYWFGYSKKDSVKLWEEASPLTHVGSQAPPALFINSGVARMHAGRNDFIKILNRYGIYSEVKTFEDAPHSFPLFQPWFDPMIGYIDAFLKKIFTK
jgi:pectinesterase